MTVDPRINVNFEVGQTVIDEVDRIAAASAEERSRSLMLRVLFGEAIAARRRRPGTTVIVRQTDEPRVKVNFRASPAAIAEVDRLAAEEDRKRAPMLRVLLGEALAVRKRRLQG